MAWKPHDPDEGAPELWDDARSSDGGGELIDSLSLIAERYATYYDVPFEEAAYRAAGESLDWWPHSTSRSLRWTPRILGSILYDENVSLVIEYVEDHWDRVNDWNDGLKLIDESALGTATLQVGPPQLGKVGTFPERSVDSRSDSLADEDWDWVFDTAVTSLHGPIRRAGELREIGVLYADEFDLSDEAAIQEVLERYVGAQDTSIVFYESMNLRWDPYSDPLDEQFAREWDDDVEALSWLGRIATIVLEWNLTERADEIESAVELFGY